MKFVLLLPFCKYYYIKKELVNIPFILLKYFQTFLIKIFTFVTSKNKTTNSPITNLKCCITVREPFKPLFNGELFLIYNFKKYFKPCFFILKALKDILQNCEFVNWWFRFLMSRAGYRGFLPYATFGTWKKFAVAKNRISKIFILCTQ